MNYEKDEIKCGEITALISVDKQQFFLNCIFCEYTFMQLEKFLHHMYESHLSKIKQINLKEADQDPFTEYENNALERKIVLEVDDENDCHIKGFERIEIELNPDDMNNILDKSEDIPEGYGDVYNNGNNTFEESVDINYSDNRSGKVANSKTSNVEQDNNIFEESVDINYSDNASRKVANSENSNFELNIFEESVDMDYSDNTPDEIDTADVSNGDQMVDLERLFHNTNIKAIFSSYAEHPELWDKKVRQPTKKEKEDIFKNIASKVDMPNEWKNIPKLISPFRFKLHTEIIRKKIYESKGHEYTPAWLTDLKTFLKRRSRLQKNVHKTKPVEMNSPVSTTQLFTDRHYVALAELYKKWPCLWDENDITYRFNNRRRDALQSIFRDFKLKTGLCLTQKDLENEITKLRKICADEKKRKILCKRNKTIYKSTLSYYDHIAFIEVNVAPYECSICGEIISSLGQFKIHLSMHDGSLPYKCHICGHEFRMVANLTVHLRRHVHDYTYNCEICNKSCATSTDLKIHMRSHTGEKPYICDICGQSLRTASLFSTHMQRHQNQPRYNCEICDKPFYTKGLLKEHMYVHLKVRDKICNVCNKGFTSNKQLRQHKYIHDKEKKFVCKICAKCFAQHAGLSGHMKSHGTSLANVGKLSDNSINS